MTLGLNHEIAMSKKLAVVLTVLSCFVSAPAFAGSVTITSNHDTTILNTNGSSSLGGGIGMFAGTNGNGADGDHRALISFDVAGNVPAGSTITGVSLTLTLAMVAGGAGTAGAGDSLPREIDLHRVTKSWGEGTAGAGTTQLNGTGQGFAASTGDATWTDSAFPSTNWNTVGGGGDFSNTVSASQIVGNPPNFTTPFTWGSTATMVSDVQSWLDDPAENFGWTLINTDEADSRTFRAFFTREAANVPSEAAFIPALTINFVPEPSTRTAFLLGALGFAAVMWRRSHRRPRR